MIVVQNLSDIASHGANYSLALTIGNFDGVHRGHREFFSHMKEDCIKDNLMLTATTFVPHPIHVLHSKTGFLINTYQERRHLLEEAGVDILYEIAFTRDFSTLSPSSFLKNYIFHQGTVKRLYLGHDFSFGANKSGDLTYIESYCQKKNIDFTIQKEYLSAKHKVSSSIIRKNLRKGDIPHANQLLNREFFLRGRIIKGQGRGKKIGFPTANLNYSKEIIIPCCGVYCTKAYIQDEVYCSVTNIGSNPTFSSTNSTFVETHILDFDQDIYGEELTVSFINKIRDEQKFLSVKDLTHQISKDIVKRRGCV